MKINRTLTEQKVLKKLDIPDFRHLSKDKVLTFASLLPNMDPEVAKKALEQFPNFASTSLDVMREYKELIKDTLKDNSESIKTCFDMYDRVMESLEKMMDNDALSFEEQVYILEQMKEIAHAVDKKESENKKFLIGAITLAGTLATGVIVALGSSLGSNIGSKSNNNDIF